MKLRLLYADLWLQRNQWTVFTALGVIALAAGGYAIWTDNPTQYFVAHTVRG